MEKQRAFNVELYDMMVYSPIYNPFEKTGPLGFPSTSSRSLSRKFNNSFESFSDFRIFSDDTHYYLTSEIRNISILINNIAFQYKVDSDEANTRILNIIDLLKSCDALYKPTSQKDVDECQYLDILKVVFDKINRKKNEEKNIKEKSLAKQAAKKNVKQKWFEIGEEYILKNQDKIAEDEVYKCVKFIYTIGKNPVNCVVMQKLGNNLKGDVRHLSVNDCRMFHIKYSPGLYMFPMTQRFYKKKVLKN